MNVEDVILRLNQLQREAADQSETLDVTLISAKSGAMFDINTIRLGPDRDIIVFDIWSISEGRARQRGVAAPLRDVTEATLKTLHRESEDGRRANRVLRWWDVQLSCGHENQAVVKYRPNGRKDRQRDEADLLPVQKRMRCSECSKGARP